MAVELVVFDCDGVILESLEIKTLAFRRLGEDYGPEAALRLEDYHRLHGGLSRYKKFAWFFREVLGREISPAEEESLNAKFVRLSGEELLRCPLVPGARESLDSLFGRLPLYVASGTPEEELGFILEKRGLAAYFVKICGSPPLKEDILRSIVDESGTRAENCLMVGDAETDRAAAAKVGTMFYGRGAYFRDLGCPWHQDMTRLAGWIESLNRS
ncbi:MAG: HAD hydrolase-like protein [Desulfovibrio sp.]|jgi:phosphoglycolate phosphatase-like HAD superfamily hydrolase|nr:HAD hydrolase-like protein [Desulfovibrio sp.]